MEHKKDICKEATQKYLDENFDNWFVKGLQEFVRIPNLTTMVDPEYFTNGNLEKAIELVDTFAKSLELQGLKKEIIKLEGDKIPPLIVYIVDPTEDGAKTVMLYGHLDKQPWMEGWDEGLHPTDPVIKGELMYGRGSSDDGYAFFASMMAVKIG